MILLIETNTETNTMKMTPSLEETRKLASEGKWDVVPLSAEILSDVTTPIEALRVLKNISTHVYMLESAQANEAWGRYTFLGYDPKLDITCLDGEMKIGDVELETADPALELRKLLWGISRSTGWATPNRPSAATWTTRKSSRTWT